MKKKPHHVYGILIMILEYCSARQHFSESIFIFWISSWSAVRQLDLAVFSKFSPIICSQLFTLVCAAAGTSRAEKNVAGITVRVQYESLLQQTLDLH